MLCLTCYLKYRTLVQNGTTHGRSGDAFGVFLVSARSLAGAGGGFTPVRRGLQRCRPRVGTTTYGTAAGMVRTCGTSSTVAQMQRTPYSITHERYR